MTLTFRIDATDRTVVMRELHALAAGEVYNPLVLDFSSFLAADVAAVDVGSLVLRLKRPDGVDVASVPMFSKVRRDEMRGVLNLAVKALADWYSEDADGGVRRVERAILEIEDVNRVYVSCPVPIVLRDFTPRGDITGYYTAAQVDDLLLEYAKVVAYDKVPTAGSQNLVTSGGIHAAISQFATRDQLASAVAGLADAQAVMDALSGKADKSDLEDLLSATEKAIADAVAGLLTANDLSSALAGYATTEALAEFKAASNAYADKVAEETEAKAREFAGAALEEAKAYADSRGPGTGSGSGTRLYFIDDSSVLPVTAGQLTYANVVGVERDSSGALAVVAFVGLAEPFSGPFDLRASAGWTHVFSDGVEVRLEDGRNVVFRSPGSTVVATVEFPDSLGLPVSPIADSYPVVGHRDRAVSSHGVAELIGKMTTVETVEDLGVLIARNATTAAKAVRAAAANLRMLMGDEEI